MSDDLTGLHPETLVVAAGRPPRSPGASVNSPIELTSTYAAGGAVGYARVGNPTWSSFEEAVGALEGGHALVLSSGMAAINAALSLAGPDAHVVVPDHTYNGTTAMLTEHVAAGGRVTRVDATDTQGFVAALDGADLLWLESPTNPMLDVVDLAAVLAASREAGVLSVVDNTLNTPLLCRPLELGADVVVHSVTKYLSGHSDVILGAVVTADDERGRALGERLAAYRTSRGAIAGPTEVFLALRGVRTLSLRVERSCANAAELARRLGSHPCVERVRYPGTGAMLAIEVAGGLESADAVGRNVRVWLDATSLGGVESLLERRRRVPLEPDTVPDNLVRLSVGIEHVDDLWHDLDAALRISAGLG